MNENLLFPQKGTLRAVFLYVGQGESTLLIVPNGENHDYILIDLNIDEENNGKEIKDLLRKIEKGKIIFINTHPHNDHIKGLEDVKDIIGEVWHSGHKPSKEHEKNYKELNEVIKKVNKQNVYYLRGSNDVNVLHADKNETSKIVKKIGDVDFQILSPVKYLCEEIDNETPEDRKKRIHEQCGVIKFTYKDKSILLTGDSNKAAWKDFITDYHKDSLKSDILSASHHGSRSFFKNNEEDKDVYEEHIEIIQPSYLVVSAPKQKDSQHNHPHNDALILYKKHIEEKNIYHLGEDNNHFIVEIDVNGDFSVGENNDTQLDNQKSAVIYQTRSKSKPYNPYAY